MENVKVFRLNEYDAVAAESLDQAKEFYQKETGLSDEEAFDEATMEELPLEYKVYVDEEGTEMQTLDSIVREYWKGKPFIAVSSD